MRDLGFSLTAVAAVVILMSGCAAAPDAAPTSQPIVTEPTPTIDYAPLPATGSFDYQLGGGYDAPEGVTIVARDSTDTPADGAYSICYVNGFQTQPGEAELWTSERSDLLIPDGDGGYRTDPDWPDEYFLDTSTEEQRAAIAEAFAPVITGCADAGFAAVEFDNLDSYTRAGLDTMTQETNLDLARRFVEIAHGAGLAAGQKNSVELGAAGRDTAGFDFAVTEECVRWGECAGYTDVYGDAVLDIEYTDDLAEPFADTCAGDDRPSRTILRDRDLVTPASADYVFEACPLG